MGSVSRKTKLNTLTSYHEIQMPTQLPSLHHSESSIPMDWCFNAFVMMLENMHGQVG